MKITVTTSTQALTAILSAGQKTGIKEAIDNKVQSDIIIQNLDAANAIYFEKGDDAAVATGIKIAAGKSLSLQAIDLDDINLISETSNVTDCRIAII